MGLVADLQALAGAVGVVDRDPEVVAKPKAGPRMVTGFAPSHIAPKWKRDPTTYQLLDEAGWFDRIRAAVPPPEGGEAPVGPGFIHSAELSRASRNGFNGLTKEGRNKVSDALQLLQERRPLLSFWTVSLPTEALLAINENDSWPLFVRRLLQKLTRRLLRVLGFDIHVGVAENQPQRSTATGMPCPHLHLVFVGRRHAKASWAISKSALDVMIKEAAQEAGLKEQVSFKSAGNVQQVKRSVRAYLSKYMTKGSGDVAPYVGGPYEGLIPRQWWHMSGAASALVESCTIQLPTEFLCWVWRSRHQLLDQGKMFIHQCEVPDGAPATYRINWGNVSKLSTLIAEWQEWVDDRYLLAKQEVGIYTVMGQSHYAKPLNPSDGSSILRRAIV